MKLFLITTDANNKITGRRTVDDLVPGNHARMMEHAASNLQNRTDEINAQYQAMLNKLDKNPDILQFEYDALTAKLNDDLAQVQAAYEAECTAADNYLAEKSYVIPAGHYQVPESEFLKASGGSEFEYYHDPDLNTITESGVNLDSYKTIKLAELRQESYSRSKSLIVGLFKENVCPDDYTIQRKIDNILSGVSDSLTAESYHATVTAFIQAYRDVEMAVALATTRAGVDLAIASWNPPVKFV